MSCYDLFSNWHLYFNKGACRILQWWPLNREKLDWKPMVGSDYIVGLLFPSIHLKLQAEGGTGWHRVTWLTGIPSWFKCTYCANGQVTTNQVVPWFFNSTYTQKGRRPYLCLLFLYHSPLQTWKLTLFSFVKRSTPTLHQLFQLVQGLSFGYACAYFLGTK